MTQIVSWIKGKLQVSAKLILLYCLVYMSWGFLMDWVGSELSIARFTYWWQVITVYVLYMVPISLLLRGLPLHAQYAYGLVAMGLLEFAGYALESSYAYPDNILDKIFGIRNFSLAMSLFFAFYFPLGNWFVGGLNKILFDKSKPAA